MLSQTEQKEIQRDSLSALLGQIIENLAAVIHDELALVTQGLREKVQDIRSGVLLLIAGAVFGLAALLSLCAALIIGLSLYFTPFAAALITGAALALTGLVVACIGYRQLKQSAVNNFRDNRD